MSRDERAETPPGADRPSVTILARSLERTGGAEQQFAQLAIGLRQLGFPVRIVTFYRGDSLEEDVRRAGVAITCIEKRGRWDTLGFGRRAYRAIVQDPPAILQSFLVPPNILAALLGMLRREIRVIWGVRASDMDVRHYDWTHRWLGLAEAHLSARADLVIANSFAGRRELIRRGFAASRIQVVPNGVDTDRFHPDRAAGAALRARWLGTASGPLIGMVARLDPMKDHATFFLAAKQLTQVAPGARFVCVGSQSTPTAAAVRRQCQELGLEPVVRWESARVDMANVMNAFDFLTLTSAFGEGFPNVIGEAMACALPVVTTDVGDAALLVGSAGLVVPPRTPQPLADAWRRLASMPLGEREHLGTTGRRRIVDEFSRTKMVERTAALYLAHHGRQPAVPRSTHPGSADAR